MKPRKEYFGLNGSATYAIILKRVFVPDEYIISEDTDKFIHHDTFYLYFLSDSTWTRIDRKESIRSMENVKNKQNG